MLDLLDKDFKSATTNMLKELIKTMSKELKYENDGSPRILIKRQKLFKRKKKKNTLGQAQWLTFIIPTPWETKAERSRELRSSSPDWATW